MVGTQIKNGDLEVLSTGLVIIQDIEQPLTISLVLSPKMSVKVSFQFEIVDDIKDAKAVNLSDSKAEDEAARLRLKIPKNVSNVHVIDTPLVTVGEKGKIYLAIGYSTYSSGEVKFEYTFMANAEVGKLETVNEKGVKK